MRTPSTHTVPGPRGDVTHKLKDHLPARSASLRLSLPASRDLLVMVHPDKNTWRPLPTPH